MKATFLFINAITILLILGSCSNDDSPTNSSINDFAVAFQNSNSSFSATETEKEITIVFAPATTNSGTLTIGYDLSNLTYGDTENFKTEPNGETGTISIPFEAGVESVSFQVNKLYVDFLETEEQTVTFTLDQVSLNEVSISGNIDHLLNFKETIASSGVFFPTVGGPNEPNQVFVDLSSQSETVVKRDTWDLAFYTGDDFRVKLNGSLYMGASALSTTDITAVTSADADVIELQSLIAVGAAGNTSYFDDPTGDISNTAINEIVVNDDENFVYLVNLGAEVGTNAPDAVGSVVTTGEPRGWKKVRVLRSGDDYVLQYADLDATDFTEVTISKTAVDFNFEFFSFNSASIVSVEPTKDAWDLSFTIFPQAISFGPASSGIYGFSDFVTINSLGATSGYSVTIEDGGITYEEYTASNIDDSSFILGDQRVIGSSWRNVINDEKTVYDNIFYILKDSDENIYKLRFLNLENDSGERGYPEFEYQLLQ